MKTLWAPPFAADEMGIYIFDSRGEMAAEYDDDEMEATARGWGRIQYLADARRRFDAWDSFVQRVCAGSKSAGEVADRLNAAWPGP